MENNVIVFEDYIAEAAATAAMSLAADALNGAIHRIIHESGGITKNEVDTISNLYTKIITEAMDEFVPSEEELEEIKKKLEAAGYKVIPADQAAAAGNGGQGNGGQGNGGQAPMTESEDLAAKIAAKLQIL